MKAITLDEYGSADVLKLRDVETPTPQGNEVLIRVRAAGVQAGDWHLMRGEPYLIRLMGYGLRKPKHSTLGMDVAGSVEAVGEHVTRFQSGDEVFGWCQGAFAEYVCAAEDKLLAKPGDLSFEEAAATPSSGLTALLAVRDKGQVQAGQRVLIIGASGGVGTFAVQIARAFGADVTGVCSAGKADLVRSLGAGRVIDYASEDFAQSGEQYDLILYVAGSRSLSDCRKALTPQGTLVLIGGEGGRWLGGAERFMQALILSPFVRHRLVPLNAVGAESADDLGVLRDLIESGKITPAIDRSYDLSETADAIRYLESGHVRGKVVVSL